MAFWSRTKKPDHGPVRSPDQRPDQGLDHSREPLPPPAQASSASVPAADALAPVVNGAVAASPADKRSVPDDVVLTVAKAAGDAAGPGGAMSGAVEQLGEPQRNTITDAQRFASAFGQIVSVALNSPQHRSMTLPELRARVVPAVHFGQYALASRRSAKDGLVTPFAVLLWATVSDEVDRRLAEGEAGVMRLTREEWQSGPHVWLVDMFGDPAALPSLAKSLAETRWKNHSVKMFVRGTDGTSQVRQIKAA